jgi:two-component system chemotaxis response regulator CheB
METQNTSSLNTPSAGASAGDESVFNIIAIASSAGGLRALNTILSELPADLPVAIVVVQHLDPHYPSMLVNLLSRRAHMRVKPAADGEPVQPGFVYIAIPDYHVLVNADHTLALKHTETERFLRPSANLLFESIALVYREHAIAVVLSGSGTDGSQGVRAIKKTGGTVVVQEAGSAEFGGMPASAISTGCADLIVPLRGIAQTLIHLVTQEAKHE